MSHHKRPRNPSAQYEPRFTIGVPIKLLHEAIVSFFFLSQLNHFKLNIVIAFI